MNLEKNTYEHEIKMIALDMDRTTLDGNGKMTDETFQVLEEAGKRGAVVVVATGRVYSALPEVVHRLSPVKYFICSNGGSVFDAGTGEILMEKCLDPAAVDTAVELVSERGYMFESFTEGKAYIGQDYYDLVKDGKLLYRTREYVMNTRIPVDDIFGFTLEHRERIENLNVFFPSQEEKALFRDKLASVKNAVLTSSFPSNYELEGEGVSKGAALSFVMDREGISRENLMAAGDSPNDISMLELAGLSVAVENAEEPVKKASIYIAPPNTEDGVAHAIRKFVLK